MSELRRTSLYQTHKDAHATLVPFAGWEMPVSYAQGTVKEIDAVRTGAGLFDVSHMGEARVTGKQALEFVQHVTTNDAGRLTPGMAQYSLLLNEAGGIQDDIIVYCHAPNDYVIVLNAGCKDADWAWLQAQAYAFPQATLTDESDATALLAVQGQHAADLVIGLADMDVAPIERFTFRAAAIGQIPCLLSRTGYTGEDGYEIFCAWDDAPALWHALAQAGAVPAGLGARDVLRLEAAYPLYGHELDAAHNPWASGVGWAVNAGRPAHGRAGHPTRGLCRACFGWRAHWRDHERHVFPHRQSGHCFGAFRAGQRHAWYARGSRHSRAASESHRRAHAVLPQRRVSRGYKTHGSDEAMPSRA